MKKSAKKFDRFVCLPGDHFNFSLDVKRFCVVEIKITEYVASELKDLSVENVTSDDLRRAIKLQKFLDSLSHSTDSFSVLVNKIKEV